MENLTLGSSSSPRFALASPRNPIRVPNRTLYSPPSLYFLFSTRRRRGTSRFRTFASSSIGSSDEYVPHRVSINVPQKLKSDTFASISSSNSSQTSSVGASPQYPVPPPTSSVGSPLFWIGVGVGFSALFSWVASYLKKYAMQQAFKSMMGQMSQDNSQFSNAPFPPVQPFPFPTNPTQPFPFPTAPTSPYMTPSPTPAASQPAAAVDVQATQVDAVPTTDVKEDTETREEVKKYAFVDVSPEEVIEKSSSEKSKESVETTSSRTIDYSKEVSTNGAAPRQDGSASQESSQSTKKSSGLSVEALEKMMEDPTVQKMVYPYLPEEMRNPSTFKWMLQNPMYRQQLEEMLNNMGGSNEWDSRMSDSLKNFDLSSPEVKQQFDQIGLTPEEVISKIMANPEVAMAFQNPKVQAAIMDCSQNPLSIAKYQNDKEVMDVFNKISELFPGVTGPP
ncbi:hypothetical protein QJS10_CPB19g00072 [Acorus calamus]|uniref:Protein TIC 40, chloroplastic n=1 Tax=Acorus calamus TaxID=4465 RepID=A0AAV9CJI2_ACOCL|nr:hypothetical protein QJS10_CPB19g00072 [Acorus calamus]